MKLRRFGPAVNAAEATTMRPQRGQQMQDPRAKQAKEVGRRSGIRDRRLRLDVDRATGGQTGLACFHAWATEPVDTGYRHNHARMTGKTTVFLN